MRPPSSRLSTFSKILELLLSMLSQESLLKSGGSLQNQILLQFFAHPSLSRVKNYIWASVKSTGKRAKVLKSENKRCLFLVINSGPQLTLNSECLFRKASIVQYSIVSIVQYSIASIVQKWIYRIARSPLVIRVLVPLHSGVGQNYNQEQLKVLF